LGLVATQDQARRANESPIGDTFDDPEVALYETNWYKGLTLIIFAVIVEFSVYLLVFAQSGSNFVATVFTTVGLDSFLVWLLVPTPLFSGSYILWALVLEDLKIRYSGSPRLLMGFNVLSRIGGILTFYLVISWASPYALPIPTIFKFVILGGNYSLYIIFCILSKL
jgi:hypothetical protein